MQNVFMDQDQNSNPIIRFPKLRWPLELRFHQAEGRNLLLIRDPAGISPTPLLLIPEVAPIVSCFEGNLSIDEILGRFQGQGLTPEILNRLITLLDDNLYLTTPRFFAAEKLARQAFLQQDFRAAAMAGAAYAQDSIGLTKEVDSYLAMARNETSRTASSTAQMLSLVAPHIDYRRGHVCYGETYNNLRTSIATHYILIGTAHQYSRRLFHLTKKDFQTPIRKLTCDRAVVTKLSKLYGEDRSFEDEMLHKNEHSLELQTPFLARLRGDSQIVPILIGGFHSIIESGKHPHEHEPYESFVAGLTEVLKEAISSGAKICFVAGVDMAHIGQQFGDKEKLSPKRMEHIRERDHIYLDALCRHDKKMLFEHIAEDNDARRICGFPTMYTVLDVLERLNFKYQARLFDYRQAVDYEAECAVTFAGMGFYQN